MSSIDIILLGMLTERPHNAYEINKIIEQRRTRTWLKISSAAVYRNLRQLHEAGHLEAHTTRDGLKPHKTVFSLTPSGRDHFVGLLEEAAESPISLHFDFDAWVANMHHLAPDRALEFLEGLGTQLQAIRDELDVTSRLYGDALPVGAAALVDLRIRVIRVTLEWLEALELDLGDRDADPDHAVSFDGDRESRLAVASQGS